MSAEAELRELIGLAQEAGDIDTELMALEKLETLSQGGAAEPQVEEPFSRAIEGALRVGGATEDDLKMGPIVKEELDIPAQVKGLSEAALTALTGATGGNAGSIAGTLEGLAREIKSGEFGTPEAAKRIEQSATEMAGRFTYAPRTEIGQERVEQLGEVTSIVGALPPVAAGFAPIAQSIKATAPIASQAARRLLSKIDDGAKAAQDVFSRRKKELYTQSVGAAEVPKAELRQLRADELPVKMKLTEGQKSREFDAQRFERETAKLAEVGAPLRERFEEQNIQLQQNLDAFIDETGAKSFEATDIGRSVSKALRSRVARDKSRIRKLYKDAEETGGMSTKVDSSDVADYLNRNRAEREENGIMTKVQRQINALEIGSGRFEEGTLFIRDLTLKESEALRRFVNKNAKWDNPNDTRVAIDIKNIIDGSTEGAGNQKYQAARRARRKLAEDFENVSLMKRLTTTKRGTTERSIALEDTLKKSIISPSTPAEAVTKLRRVLQTSGDEGNQAWKDLQGGTLQYIQDEMIKNVTTNQRGDRVVSAPKLDKAIRDLDRSGKLDIVFGKKGAEQLRTINDVAKTVLTSPPDAVNTSNTATVLAGLMDVAISGTAAVPLPILSAGRMLTQSLKDKKLRRKVKIALGETEGKSK